MTLYFRRREQSEHAKSINSIVKWHLCQVRPTVPGRRFRYLLDQE